MLHRQTIVMFFGSFWLCGALAADSEAATEQIIYNFPFPSSPYGRPVEDGTGALFGTAGQQDNYGTVYQLKQKNGIWRFKLLHAFSRSDGAGPYAGLMFDHRANTLYGVTLSGGPYDGGTAYALLGNNRRFEVIHNFSPADGEDPFGSLTQDPNTGFLYGTTEQRDRGCGTAFQLNESGAAWSFSKLYGFTGEDGCGSETPLERPRFTAGDLLGETVYGGSYNQGVVFELKESGGTWTEKVVHTFTGGKDGASPYDLTEASKNGAIYGVAGFGGATNNGVIFKLIPNQNTWRYRVIYDFNGGSDGSVPVGLFLSRGTGVLYGTTGSGGSNNNGTLFKLTFDGSSWNKSTLHNFTGGAIDGAIPGSGPMADSRTGTLYGTTLMGGTSNAGTVYAVTP